MENDYIEEFLKKIHEQKIDSVKSGALENCYEKILIMQKLGFNMFYIYGWLCGFWQGGLQENTEFLEALADIIHPAMIRVYGQEFLDYIYKFGK